MSGKDKESIPTTTTTPSTTNSTAKIHQFINNSTSSLSKLSPLKASLFEGEDEGEDEEVEVERGGVTRTTSTKGITYLY
jgi:hypothetical protein